MVCQAARECLALFSTGGKGSLHPQSQRFLNPDWKGLRGDMDPSDPPLRHWVERLAAGENIIDMYNAESHALAPFLHFVSGFRLVTRLPVSHTTYHKSHHIMTHKYPDSQTPDSRLLCKL